MNFIEFIKPNKEKILLTIFGYAIFYLLDIIILAPIELFYIPNEAGQIMDAPWIFWVFRMGGEVISFYVIASFLHWVNTIIPGKRQKTFLSYLRLDKITIISVLGGDSVFSILSTLLYVPVLNIYAYSTESVSYPFELTLATMAFYMLFFYVFSTFSKWLHDVLGGRHA